MTDQFVTVVCNKCNTEYEISVTYAGMPGECGNCGEVFVFPSKEDINAAFGYDVCGQVAAAQAAEAAGEQAAEEVPQSSAEESGTQESESVAAEEPPPEPSAPAFHGAAPAEDEIFTSTIKMSRSKIAGGMIPKVSDDEYGFSYVKKSSVTESAASVTEKDIQEIKAILESNEKEASAAGAAKRKWWQYILFWIRPKE